MSHPRGEAALPLRRVRSLLFMPALRADMIAKIPGLGADLAVADLEDAVAVGDKDEARGVAMPAIDALPETATTVLVRVNPVGTSWCEPDVAAVARSAAAGVVVPKLETLVELRTVEAAWRAASARPPVLVAGIESALGVADARELLAAGVSAAYFGAEDYAADLGGRRTRAGLEVLYARSQVALAARLAGVPAIDQAVVTVGDPDHFTVDARAGADLGYQGKICIHPSQVGLAHAAFTPTPEQVEHARAVLAAGESGVGLLDGEMVDEVHLRMARAVLSRADTAPATGDARPARS